MICVVHPTGIWFLDTYEDADELCEMLGETYDLNSIGVLKSRCAIYSVI